MSNKNSLIYGLEFQARALAPQLAETEKIKFLIGTQSLKQATNQIHLIDFNEEVSTIKTTVFHHSEGEIWRITTSPLDALKLSTCYNVVVNESSCSFKTAILKLPETDNPDTIDALEVLTKFDTEIYGGEIKTTEFHPIEAAKAASVIESNVVLWDIADSNATPIKNFHLDAKHSPKFTTGKWNPHQGCNQFTAATETHLKTYDIRSGDLAWQIDGAHHQLVRDLDFNMNKQYHVATCGDDGFVKIWDFRQPTAPVYSQNEHSHWVWSVRFNYFHDQLILTASSDSRVLVSSAASVSSEISGDINNMEEGKEDEKRQVLNDGPLQWCEHEDSVYCAEWSPADPWVFASLSYDGRLLISRVNKSLKYQIML